LAAEVTKLCVSSFSAAQAAPNAAAAREAWSQCLATLGMSADITERIGEFPSPTVLINGNDVMRPDQPAPTGQYCRLDLPTPDRILVALRQAATGS